MDYIRYMTGWINQLRYASRPGPLRADLEGRAVHEGKGGVTFGPTLSIFRWRGKALREIATSDRRRSFRLVSRPCFGGLALP